MASMALEASGCGLRSDKPATIMRGTAPSYAECAGSPCAAGAVHSAAPWLLTKRSKWPLDASPPCITGVDRK